MKYLVAANPEKIKKHSHARDFFFARPNEIVIAGILICTDPAKREACGCGRSMSGISSLKSSTIFVVAEGHEAQIKKRFQASKFVKEWSGFPGCTADQMWERFVVPISQQLNSHAIGKLIRISQTPGSFQIWEA